MPRRTKEQIFYADYEKTGKKMGLSPTQYANLVIDNFHNGTKIGRRKVSVAMVKGADSHLASIHPSYQEEEEQPKKKGRPKKVVIEKEISEAIIPKKRGRPKKIETIEKELMGEEDKPKNPLLKKVEQNTDPKRNWKGRPRKYETEEERKMNKRVNSVNSANRTKLKKKLEQLGLNIGKDGMSINDAVRYVIQRPEHFDSGIINLAKRVETYLKPEKEVSTKTPRIKGKGVKEDAIKNYGMFLKHLENHIIDPKEPIDPKDYIQSNKIIKAIKKIKGGELPHYEDLNWGSLTKQLKSFKVSHPNINTLEKFAKYIINNKDDFQEKTIKRANFYLNVILKGKGIYDSSSSDSESSDGESSSDEGDSKTERNEVDSYLLGFGMKKILSNSIMPKFAKGSPEMKEHMAKLRAMKGKGVKGSMSKTHKGELDYTTKKGDKYYHIEHHLVEGNPYEEGGAVLLPKGHLANRLSPETYGLRSTTMMNVPMSRTPRVINAGGVRPPPMLNSSYQRYEGVDDSSRLGTAGNMSFHSLMSL